MERGRRVITRLAGFGVAFTLGALWVITPLGHSTVQMMTSESPEAAPIYQVQATLRPPPTAVTHHLAQTLAPTPTPTPRTKASTLAPSQPDRAASVVTFARTRHEHTRARYHHRTHHLDGNQVPWRAPTRSDQGGDQDGDGGNQQGIGATVHLTTTPTGLGHSGAGKSHNHHRGQDGGQDGNSQ